MKRTALALVVTALMVTACGGAAAVTATERPAGAEAELGRLAAAEKLWDEMAPEDYTITQFDRVGGGEEESGTLAIRDREVVSLGMEPATVDEAFATIADSIRRGATVDVEYDPEYGYPVRAAIDRDGDGNTDVQLGYADLTAMPAVQSVAELHAARRRWKAQQLDSYRYIFRFDCTCPESGTFQVDVSEGRVVRTVPLDDAARRSDLDPGFAIDSAFDDLEEWFANSAELIDEGILAVDVRMDPLYGYPRWFRIQAKDADEEFFEGRFTMVVTIDLIAGSEPVEPVVDPDDLEQVQSAQARWEQASISDYRYVLTIHCLCPAEVAGPFQITVSGGALDSVRQLDIDKETEAHVFHVDDALAMIGQAVLDGTDVDVTYALVLGYPQQVIIDTEAVAVDGGLAFAISDFEQLG